jgi:uncharacterized cupredoxin-like copper-binding protein
MRRCPRIAIGLAAVVTVAASAGCGGGGGDTTKAAQPASTKTSGAPAATHVAVIMGDYFFKPKDANAKAGSVTITAPNEGKLVHELVLARTNAAPGALPTTSDGGVDEAKLESQGRDAGEVADVEPGKTKQGVLKLKPGRYVMFCNVPGHYAQGMYGTLTVK